MIIKVEPSLGKFKVSIDIIITNKASNVYNITELGSLCRSDGGVGVGTYIIYKIIIKPVFR